MKSSLLYSMLGLGLAGILTASLVLPPKEVRAFIDQKAPGIESSHWLNSEPILPQGLRGKVVLVEFWTFGCYNCRNVEPKVKEWHRRYKDQGLVVISIHSPEFSYERDINKVKDYVRTHEIKYPVAIDNDFKNWNRFHNRYWPAIYLIDKEGLIRYLRVGEGGYNKTERMIKTLIAEVV